MTHMCSCLLPLPCHTRVLASMPYRFVQNLGLGDIIVGPGLTATNLSLVATGTGGVYVTNASVAGLLRLQGAGCVVSYSRLRLQRP
jgi:hypothetical protein